MIVYLIYNLINGKCYVGQTVKTLERRWYLHCKGAKGKSKLPIHNAIRKYEPKAFMVGWLSHATSRFGKKASAETRRRQSEGNKKDWEKRRILKGISASN